MANSRYLRHPKTTQEARRNSGDEKEFARPKRRKANLPNAWDDIVIDGVGKRNTSWKRKGKKKQWK